VPDGQLKPLADAQRLDQTLDSADSLGELPAKEVRKAEDHGRLDQTLDSADSLGELPAKEIRKAEDRGRLDQTLDSADGMGERPAKEARKPGDPGRFDQTLDSAEAGAAPAEKEGRRTDGRGRSDQTLDSAEAPAAPNTGAKTDKQRHMEPTLDSGSVPSPIGKTAQPVRTIDSAEPSEDLAGRVSMLWSGKLGSDASPRTSLKAASRAAEGEVNVTIQSRVLRRPGPAEMSKADYELLNTLGEGGMGVVLMARQASIDRLVAVKMLKPAGAKDPEARKKFLAEAAVTGDLEHPNIVPIYELGTDEKDTLFYSMKRVKGTPWSKEIRNRSIPENLEILMKVSDAVAFAHSRNVLHRDLKPENVMLGDFGEVLLMDWGLAISLRAARRGAGMAGTPAYMAPEMAFGASDRIDFRSDVYLLGAILYEIVTGNPPHAGKTVLDCLTVAARNEIRPTEKSGELLDVALRAMASDPRDRYGSAGEFQTALRQYQSHSQSILLAVRAEEELREAETSDDYERYARARFGFQEAQTLWNGNQRAREGIVKASAAYAQSALRKGDYDLGATLLSPEIAGHAPILRELAAARRERDARQGRLKAAKRIGVGLVATIFAVISVAFFWIRAEADNARRAEAVAQSKRQEAVQQREIADAKSREAQAERAEAEAQAEIARRQTRIAEQQTTEAVHQRKRADQQRSVAERAQQAAETARNKEEYEAYVARIGLAAAKIEENAFDRALALLQECPPQLRDWEWGRLMHLCTQDVRSFDGGQPLDAVAVSPDGRRLIAGGWGGAARIWDIRSGKELLAIPTGGTQVFAVAFSPDGRQVAIGTNGCPDYLKTWDAQSGQPLKSFRGHQDAVLSVVYSRDGRRLLSSSYDATARLWDAESGRSQVFAGHEWWVWSAAFSPDEQRIVTACQDGSAMVWPIGTRRPGPPFLGHAGPVYSACFSPDGRLVTSAGYDGRILFWDPEKIRPFQLGSGSAQSNPAVVGALEGHAAGVRGLAYSADGKLLVTGGYDNTVRVWHVAARRLLKTLRGHASHVQACAFVPKGGWVLSASHDHLAKLWNLAGYEEVRVFRGLVLEGHRDAVLGADFSPDNRQIVSASRDRSAKLWDAASGKEIRQFLQGHQFLASRAAFFPDGHRLLSAAVDNTTRIWDVATGGQLLALAGTGPAAAVALSGDGRWLLSGSDDKTAKLWDAAAGKLLRQLEGHHSEVTAVAISPDNRWLLTGDARGRLRLWDASTAVLKWESHWHTRGITAAGFLPRGEAVLTASLDHTVAQWEVRSGRERSPWILKHPDAVLSMAIAPDGRRALTVCADREVRLWDVPSGRFVTALRSAGEAGNSVSFSPDGRRGLVTTARGNLRLWDLETLREIGPDGSGKGPWLVPSAAVSQTWSAVFSPDGGAVLTVGGNEACLWDAKTARPGMRFSPHNSVASARFSPDGKRVVTGSWDNTARIWNAQTGLAELRLEGHTRYVNDAAFSPDGAAVVTASDDGTARLWDARTARPLGVLRGHEDRVASAAFSADGRRVLTASNDKTARIWDARSGRLLHVLRGHSHAVLHAAFSSDGTRVITGGEDNRARLWDAHTAKEFPFRLEGHTASVTSVAFSPSGRRAITGSQDQTAKIWDTETGKEILTLKGHSREVTAVGFSPDGRSALTGSRDGTLLLWLAAPWGPAGLRTAGNDRR
jgi:hypothetical protein